MPKHDANIRYKACKASNCCHLYIGQDKDFTAHFGEEHKVELRTYKGSFISILLIFPSLEHQLELQVSSLPFELPFLPAFFLPLKLLPFHQH
jgi:hypothetical protein